MGVGAAKMKILEVNASTHDNMSKRHDIDVTTAAGADRFWRAKSQYILKEISPPQKGGLISLRI